MFTLFNHYSTIYSHKNKLDMKPLIYLFCGFIRILILFDKDDEIKLRNVDQISLESNSTMPERVILSLCMRKGSLILRNIFYESQNRRIISLRNKIFVLKYLFI